MSSPAYLTARRCEDCGSKLCRVCGDTKSAEQFRVRLTRRGGHGHRNDCLSCEKTRRDAYYQANKDTYRNANLRRVYGISVEDYDAMYEAQGGCCAICGVWRRKTDASSSERDFLVVDHNHQTGVVRKLLCQGCNHGIGAFQENIDFLVSAVAYLLQEGVACSPRT